MNMGIKTNENVNAHVHCYDCIHNYDTSIQCTVQLKSNITLLVSHMRARCYVSARPGSQT